MKIEKLLEIKRNHEDNATIEIDGKKCVLVVTNCCAAFDYGLITTEIQKFDDWHRIVSILGEDAGHQVARYRSGGMAHYVTHVKEIQDMLA